MTHPPGRTDRPPRFWGSKGGLVAIAFLAIGAFLLLSEHRAHVLGYWPFLLLLPCLFLHRFMHGGHGGDGRGRSDRAPPEGG